MIGVGIYEMTILMTAIIALVVGLGIFLVVRAGRRSNR